MLGTLYEKSWRGWGGRIEALSCQGFECSVNVHNHLVHVQGKATLRR